MGRKTHHKHCPLILQDGTKLVRIGIMSDACCSGISMLPETALKLGFNHGDYLQMDHDERGTSVVREFVRCRRGRPLSALRGDHVYIDGLSAYFMQTECHDIVKIKQAEYPVENP